MPPLNLTEDVILAGKYGSLSGKCDIPNETLKEGLIYIRDILKPDILVYTGDNSPNDNY